MKKVLFVATVESHIVNFHLPYLKFFLDRGFEVHIAAKISSGDLLDTLGVFCHNISFSRSPLNPSNMTASFQLYELLTKHYFELIHTHTPVAAFLGRMVASLVPSGPVLYTAHGLHFYKGAPLRNWLFYCTTEIMASRLTNGIILINKDDYSFAQKHFYSNCKKFFVRGVGINVSKYQDSFTREQKLRLMEELGIDESMKVGLVVAELIPRKNHSQIIKAWGTVLRESPKAVLVMAGDGPLKTRLHKHAKRLGIIKNVRFLGLRKDVHQLMAIADVIILTSKQEGLPRAIMEAMAAGKPIICTRIRGNTDLIEDEKTGLMVEVNDIDNTARRIIRVFQDEPYGKKIAKAAMEKIGSYGEDVVLDEMQRIYEVFLKEPLNLELSENRVEHRGRQSK